MMVYVYHIVTRRSRFGKYTELHYNGSGNISGSSIKQYLLEKSRLVTQQENEVRNGWCLGVGTLYGLHLLVFIRFYHYLYSADSLPLEVMMRAIMLW